MLLDTQRLLESDLIREFNTVTIAISLLSWAVSWTQVPAGSLPDDDAKLAYMLRFGRDVRAFRRMRARGAMRGWVKCSDGRLYHPVVCAKAIEAMDIKTKNARRTQAARRARHPTPAQPTPPQANGHGKARDLVPENRSFSAQPPPTTSEPTERDPNERVAQNGQVIVFPRAAVSVDNPVTLNVTSSNRREEKRREEEERKKEPSLRDAHGEVLPDARTILFSHGVLLLMHMSGRNNAGCRTLLGKLLRLVDDDAAVAQSIVGEAVELRLSDPVAWIMAAGLARGRPRQSAASIDREWGLESLASPEAIAAVDRIFGHVS